LGSGRDWNPATASNKHSGFSLNFDDQEYFYRKEKTMKGIQVAVISGSLDSQVSV
jgi:hypothetical protein